MGSCLSADGRNHPSPDSPQTLGFRKIHGRRSFQERIPGRMSSNGASEMACMFTQQGKKGTNQDAMVVWEKFGSRADSVFCGVFDGHGPHGHLVARRVRDSLPMKLRINLGRLSVKESYLMACKVMDRELRMQAHVDCFCSGTTAVTLIKQGEDLVIGNVGDSRAVLGTRDEHDSLRAVQLTVDLKPNLPEEAERIRKCRGRVFALQDEPDVARVWLPNHDSPGLAMARAFGDFCLKDFGLISVPDVSYRRLTDKDQFVVLASDGVWDVLTNKEVVDIIASAPVPSASARLLVESAIRAWRFKYPTSKIDDCAVVCLFLHLDKKEHCRDHRKSVRNGGNGAIISGDDEDKGEDSESDDADMADESEKNWSALEGVARVNTLVTLPRFLPEKDERKKK